MTVPEILNKLILNASKGELNRQELEGIVRECIPEIEKRLKAILTHDIEILCTKQFILSPDPGHSWSVYTEKRTVIVTASTQVLGIIEKLLETAGIKYDRNKSKLVVYPLQGVQLQLPTR